MFVSLTKVFCTYNSIAISSKYFLDICILATTRPDLHQRLLWFPEAFSILISIYNSSLSLSLFLFLSLVHTLYFSLEYCNLSLLPGLGAIKEFWT